jgi:hypothetical protein
MIRRVEAVSPPGVSSRSTSASARRPSPRSAARATSRSTWRTVAGPIAPSTAPTRTGGAAGAARSRCAPPSWPNPAAAARHKAAAAVIVRQSHRPKVMTVQMIGRGTRAGNAQADSAAAVARPAVPSASPPAR